ncbi:MAG: hypothetical protein AAGH64_03115 [Planctomycetota bacterium]
MHTFRLATALAVFAVVGIALVLAQPSLTPPAGPIDETGRFGTLIELSQETAPGDSDYRFIIQEPGSYILTGDVNVGNDSGILILTNHVTIDLNGYTLSGSGEAGVDVLPAEEDIIGVLNGITVRNGRIIGFRDGIDASDLIQGVGSNSFRYTNYADLYVDVSRNGLEAENGQVLRCTVRAQDTGIEGFDIVVRDCVVEMLGNEPSQHGIRAIGSVVDSCAVDMFNSTAEVSEGIEVFDGVVRGSRVRSQTIGFRLRRSIAEGCVSTSDQNTIGSESATFASNF